MSVADAVARLPYAPPPFEPGHVWLAGAGPGGLGCLTLEVAAALQAADVVIYDALVDPAVLQAACGARHLYVGKRGGEPSTPQDTINRLMVAEARAGRRVLRLKGGDPNTFGRGGEEALALAAAGIPFRFLPGVTSAFGALAAAGIPATMRGVNKAIVLATGHAAGTPEDLDWAALAGTGQPIVIYMGMRNLEAIAKALMAGGLSGRTPAAILMAATTAGERVLVARLETIAERARAEGFRAPALIVVGDIVGQRRALAPRQACERMDA
ncbi:uroporphyrinogen-III C-methyltransferase [Chelativorans intermedius]|uniref:uroporphyrinogen-III C-methyltransferase n=1 Tax=Chelativorans intermedius TaxID=515947 RepID=A0ABV6D5E7_9HYPH|nr:uroporphyrinogen-III C-methyltransferase [Chelativorans intermedius]MCT8997098.1 uroporphyrinogen-III C-methyltransferase [Chelativorans intermedius]